MVDVNILDIGARYGVHPSWKKFRYIGNFYLVEADNTEAKKLKKKYKKLKNIKVFSGAISDKDQILKINILKNPAMSGSKMRNNVSPLYWRERKIQAKVVRTINVKALSLDNFVKKLKKKIDFLKIDIEGEEFSILNASKTAVRDLLGIRCEVNFLNIFEKDKNYSGSFVHIHNYLVKNNFILLNLDYDGVGDHYSQFILNNQKRGMLQNTDAVWIKKSFLLNKMNDQTSIIKIAIFLFLNNAPDLAIWILLKNAKRFSKYRFYKNTKPYEFLHKILAAHFYKLKWAPGQSLKKHKVVFENILNETFPDMNKYNDSILFNPV